MNVEIYPEMILVGVIHISIYPIPILPSPILEKELTAEKHPENDTGKRQKSRYACLHRHSGLKGVLVMPRMSKKRRLEWAFFLNHRNRITYNELCRKCVHDCKQSFRVEVTACPRYQSKRAKEDNNES